MTGDPKVLDRRARMASRARSAPRRPRAILTSGSSSCRRYVAIRVIVSTAALGALFPAGYALLQNALELLAQWDVTQPELRG
jgi:hypothetical protein